MKIVSMFLLSYQLLPISVGFFLTGLNAYGCMLHFMLLTCSFLCSVFIMSQAYTTTGMTIPLVTFVLQYVISPTVTMAPSLMGLPATSGQHDVLLPPLLILRYSGGVVGFATMPNQQHQSQMPLQPYANYAMDPPQVGFSFRVEPPTVFIYVWCLFWCMPSAFRCHAGCCIHLWGLNHWGLHHCSPLELTYGRHICNLAMVIGPHQECTKWLLPPLL